MLGLTVLITGALILAYLSVHGVRYIAEQHEILDVANERSSHTGSIPRGAGLAIFAVTLLALWVYVPLKQPGGLSLLAPFTLGAIMIASISGLDDLRSQPNWLRFLVHSVAALLAIYSFGYFPSSIVSGDQILGGWLSLIIIFVWIAGLTNAYNFMDGIDGIAGGQAIVAGLGWAILGSMAGQSFVFVMGLLLAATSLGFLFHNWQPARIFMGDAGSAFLGYSFAVMPLMFNSHLSSRAGGLGPVIAGALLVWPFVFDSTFTFLRRLSRGENVFSAHRSHLYQRLAIVGYSHRFVALLYSGLALIGIFLAAAWFSRLRNSTTAVAVVLPLLCFSLWIFVTRSEYKVASRLRSRLPTYVDPA